MKTVIKTINTIGEAREIVKNLKKKIGKNTDIFIPPTPKLMMSKDVFNYLKKNAPSYLASLSK